MRFNPIRQADGSLQVDHRLPNSPEGRALAASVRSGAATGLSPSSFTALDEAQVSRCPRSASLAHHGGRHGATPELRPGAGRSPIHDPSRGVVAAMSWWRRQPEVRGYTETQLLDQFTRAVAGNVRHGALGGLQCAAGAVARAFAAAEVDGDEEGLLDPTTLYQMGFDLIREGQSVWLLEAGTGRLRLTRASTGSDVYHGGPAS